MMHQHNKLERERSNGAQVVPNRIKARFPMRRRGLSLVCILSVTMLVSGAVYAQASRFMPPIFMLLLDEVDNLLKAIPTGKLNDTGITLGMDSGGTSFNSSCVADTLGAQDCNYGADLQPDTDEDGHAGFSFTLVDDNGQIQDPQKKDTACAVLDNVTGLMWDSGRPEPGLKELGDAFNWFEMDDVFTNLEFNGKVPSCFGYDVNDTSTYCNSKAYIARLNVAGWCGHSDWRLPNLTEIHGIMLYENGSNVQSFLSQDHFFDVPNAWTSTIHVFDSFSVEEAGLIIRNADFDKQSVFAPTYFKGTDELLSIMAVRND